MDLDLTLGVARVVEVDVLELGAGCSSPDLVVLSVVLLVPVGSVLACGTLTEGFLLDGVGLACMLNGDVECGTCVLG